MPFYSGHQLHSLTATPIPYDDYIEESIGIMMEDGEITDDDLEEIDNYLDSLNYTNECQEINFFINKFLPLPYCMGVFMA